MDAAGWNERHDTTELVGTTERNLFLVAETSALAPRRTLELRAGEGRHAVWLAQHGWQVTAVDFSDVGLGKNLTDGHGDRQDPDILFSSEDALGRARRPVGR